MKVVVHIAAGSGVSSVELVSLSRLSTNRGEGNSREGCADGPGDGSHGE